MMMKCLVEIQLNDFNCQCDGIIRQNEFDLNGGGQAVGVSARQQ
jgi:hypothetical protein